MQELVNFFKTDYIFLGFNFLVIIMAIVLIYVIISNIKLRKKYNLYIKKIGNGKNIEEDLENYMYRVERVEKQNAEILGFCTDLDKELSKCIQKIGIVRYSAFKDTGSDLSFAVAMLDENNNGIVFNGIYSREMSNIYAKPVTNGNSTYTLSDEEKEAISTAINSNNLIKLR